MKQILWLLIVALLIVGCAKPYLPPEFRTACEMRPERPLLPDRRSGSRIPERPAGGQ